MHNFLSLRAKMMTAFLCIALITAVVGISGYMGMTRLGDRFNQVTDSAPLIRTATQMKLAVSQDLRVVMALMAALDTDELAAAWKTHKAHSRKFTQLKEAILNGAVLETGRVVAATDPELREIVTRAAAFHADKFVPSFATIFDQMKKQLSAEPYDYDLLDTIDETTIGIGNKLDQELTRVVEITRGVITRAEQEVKATQTLVVNITLAATILGILAAVLLGYLFSGIVTRPVIRAAEFTRVVADGDFTASLDIRHRDEIGTMAAAMNKMVDSLAAIFQDLAKGIITLNQTASQLSDVSRELQQHAGNMSDKTAAVSQASHEMNSRLSSVAGITRTSSDNLNTVSAAVEQMNGTVNEIAVNTGEAREITENAVERTRQASVRVNQLGEDAREIGQVTQVIGEISEQTSLLALNATIEAARAGEAGKGFAVVANEIKELATQTADAADNITAKIKRIQVSTEDTVTQINSISGVITDVNNIVTTIASAVEEQTAATNEIAGNIARAAGGIEDTSTHISTSSHTSDCIDQDIAGLRDTACNLAGSSRKMAESIGRIRDFAGRLNQTVSKFNI